MPNRKGKKKNTEITLATWNVQTMLKPGKMKEIMEELGKARVDIVAVQEIRWQGQGRIDKKDFSLFYSGPKERTGRYGTGFIVSAKIRKSLLAFEPLSDRLCKLRLRGKFRNITLLSTYAPTEDSSDTLKDEFYDQLSRECEKAHKYDILILLGDFNAKIGTENFIATVAGKYTLHEETSENGKRLGQLAARYNMIIKSTCFEHKRIHKGTWICPGTNVVNQIDHVVINKRHASIIIDVKSCRGPSCDSDHFLVKATLRERLSNAHKNQGRKKKRWNIDKLKYEEELNLYQQRVNENLKETVESQDVQIEWNKIKNVIVEAAKESIGEKTGRRNEEWFDEECRVAIQEKNKKREIMLQRMTRWNKEIYREYRRKANKICREKKREMLKRQIESIERNRERADARKYYQIVNWLRKGFQPRMKTCKDNSGKLIGDNKILEHWAKHFKIQFEIENDEENEEEEVF